MSLGLNVELTDLQKLLYQVGNDLNWRSFTLTSKKRRSIMKVCFAIFSESRVDISKLSVLDDEDEVLPSRFEIINKFVAKNNNVTWTLKEL